MAQRWLLVCGALVACCAFASGSDTNASWRYDWRQRFLQVPSAARAFEHLSIVSSAPHIAGSNDDQFVAKYVFDQMKSYGLSVEMQEFEALVNYPTRQIVELQYPVTKRLDLREPYIAKDPFSGDPRITPAFMGYSPTGLVSAELVYINYCSMRDFGMLKDLGVIPHGKIGICRYGQISRETKAMLAQRAGLAGLLLYSDPADDGFRRGKEWPEGPWRPARGVQRGSVKFSNMCPGDPRRKACASGKVAYNFTHMIPEIPVVPLSWANVMPLMEHIGHAWAPVHWKGGMNVSYHVGPGPARVFMDVEMNFTVKRLRNVVAHVKGRNEHRQVIIGNHRDAWVFGAAGPGSGTATLLEVARGIGELMQQGWQPNRTIVLANWDGGEFGYLGSTNWAENNAVQINSEAVAYLDVGVGVFGRNFSVRATPSLATLFDRAAEKVADPASGELLSRLWSSSRVSLMGAGDHLSFLNHFGIASASLSFGLTDEHHMIKPYGVYHSAYDNLLWMIKFGDPTFQYHQALARLWGVVALSLADNEFVPMNYTAYSHALCHMVAAVQKSIARRGQKEQINLSRLRTAVSSLAAAAQKAEDHVRRRLDANQINDRLIFAERMLLGPGLPMRPYYKHVVQAPGLFSGEPAVLFPGVLHGLKSNDHKQTQEQLSIVSKAIESAAARLSGGDDASDAAAPGHHVEFSASE